jgi:hypothetical protein
VRRLKAEMNFPVDALGADGVEVQDRFALEVGTSFAVARELAEKVRDATGRGAFPLVLGELSANRKLSRNGHMGSTTRVRFKPRSEAAIRACQCPLPCLAFYPTKYIASTI